MNLEIPESLFESLQIIIKYQNTLLLKEISKEKGWKFSELKKEFLKDEEIETLVKKYNKKQKKLNKKKDTLKEEKETEVKLNEPEVKLNEPKVKLNEPEVKLNEPEVKVNQLELVINETEEVENKLVNETQEVVNEPIVLEEPSILEDPPKKKKKLKRKITKVINNVEIKCLKYEFDGHKFYVNVENDNAYDENLEFVGKKLGNGINFNADE